MTPNSFAAGAVLIKVEIPSFVLTQGPSPPTNVMMGVKTIWELCLFQVRPFIEVANGEISFFDRKRLEPKAVRVPCCFSCDVHLWCQVSRTLPQYFQRYCLFSISPLLSCKRYDSITDLIYIIGKTSFFCILKGLSNKRKLFFTS